MHMARHHPASLFGLIGAALLPGIAVFLGACNDPQKQSSPSSATSAALTSASSRVAPAPSAAASPAVSASASPHTMASVVAPPMDAPNAVESNENADKVLLAWRPNGKAFAAAVGKNIALIPVDGSKPTPIEALGGNANTLVFSIKGDRLATNDATNKVRVWDPNSGKLIADLPDVPPGDINDLVFSDDGKLLSAASNVAVIWDIDKKKKRCATEETIMHQIAFTRDQLSLVTTGAGNHARWDTTTCVQKASGSSSTGGTFGSWVSPGGKYAAAAAEDGHALYLYEAKSFQEIERLAKSDGCQDHIGPLRFSRDGEILFAMGSFKWFRSFRLDSKKTIAAYPIPQADEVDLTIMFDDGERLLLVRKDKGELISAVDKKLALTIDLKGASTFDVSWDRRYLLGANAKEAFVWDTQTGKLVRSFSMPK